MTVARKRLVGRLFRVHYRYRDGHHRPNSREKRYRVLKRRGKRGGIGHI